MNQFTLVFGIVSILLGAIGFFKKGSKPSLIAGGISGLLLLLGWWLTHTGVASGKWVVLVVAVLLLGRFLPGFLKSKSLMPAGIMAGLSVVQIGLVVAGMIK